MDKLKNWALDNSISLPKDAPDGVTGMMLLTLFLRSLIPKAPESICLEVTGQYV